MENKMSHELTEEQLEHAAGGRIVHHGAFYWVYDDEDNLLMALFPTETEALVYANEHGYSTTVIEE